MHRYRTHTCGQLTKAEVDDQVRLSGWLHNRRDLGGLLFADGLVLARRAANINPEIPTGEVEVEVVDFEVLGTCTDLPFTVFPEESVSEELRLTYRFPGLRRQRMHANVMLRARVIETLQQKLNALGFTEFQTPILASSSPEGARDFLVPSRRHPGQFFALPQAPQQFKQLLMVAGFDKYFQIAPCFRDEDSRADRSRVNSISSI